MYDDETDENDIHLQMNHLYSFFLFSTIVKFYSYRWRWRRHTKTISWYIQKKRNVPIFRHTYKHLHTMIVTLQSINLNEMWQIASRVNNISGKYLLLLLALIWIPSIQFNQHVFQVCDRRLADDEKHFNSLNWIIRMTNKET